MMRRYSLTLALAFLTGTAVSAQPAKDAVVATVTGRVMLDANNNGKLDTGDKGLADVVVSDGIQFVRTAADGSYTLTFADDPLIPYKPAQVLAVCWPSGVWPAGQRFWVRRADIKRGQGVDFLLRPMKQELPFTFAHGSDPHDNVCGGEWFNDDIRRMGERVKFCLMTGDLGYATRESAPKMFASLRDATRRFPVPMLHAPGNHDICDIHTNRWSEQDSLAGYGPYTEHLGPLRYSFTYAGVHFVGLDWARIMDDGKLQTGVPDGVIDWLKKDLAALKPKTRTFVFMHHDFRHGDDRFWDVLVQHKVELVIAGHSHRNKEETRRGVPRLTTQNLCGPYRLITIHDKGHTIVNRCFAGNGPGHTHSYAGKCKMAEWKLARRTPGQQKEIANRDLDSASLLIEGLRAKNLEIVADIDPGTAKRFGVRLTPADAKAAPLELVFEGDDLRCGDVVTSAVSSRGQKASHFRLILDNGIATVFVNNRVQFERAYQPGQPCGAALFADGGRVRCNKVEVWELKGER